MKIEVSGLKTDQIEDPDLEAASVAGNVSETASAGKASQELQSCYKTIDDSNDKVGMLVTWC